MFLLEIENIFSYIRLITLKILTVKKPHSQFLILPILLTVILPILLFAMIGCAKDSKTSKPLEVVEKPFTVDSVSVVSSFLVLIPSEKSIYSVIECTKITTDSIRCYAFNDKSQSFDTLYGYFNQARAFEITNSTNSVNIRASFKENGNGNGVLSTSFSSTFVEFRFAPFIIDSFFVEGEDSVLSFTSKLNNIEYQLTFPTFKHPSARKNVIFTTMVKNSLLFFQQYVDSLNPKEFHFLKYKAICKKVGIDIWNYSWYPYSENKKDLALFEISFQESTSMIVSTKTVESTLENNYKGEITSSIVALKLLIDSVPISNFIGVSEKGISIYNPHKSTKYFPFQIQNSRNKVDSTYNLTSKNRTKN